MATLYFTTTHALYSNIKIFFAFFLVIQNKSFQTIFKMAWKYNDFLKEIYEKNLI